MTLEEASRDAGAPVVPDRTGPADAIRNARPSALRGHADFNKLWAGQSVSSVGSEVTKLALPLTAVLYLHASAAQVGLMTSAALLAYSGPSLLFGVLADRVRRRPLMIGADLGRAAVLALVPVLAWTGTLSMGVVYAVALVHGALTVIFDVAYRSYLPGLVAADDLLAGNSRLQATESVSQVGGPALSGALVALLTAPFALLVDAGSFLVSVGSVLWIRAPEAPPRATRGGTASRARPAALENGAQKAGTAGDKAPGRRTEGKGAEPRPGALAAARGVVSDVASGLRFIYRHPVLRAVAGSAATFNFFSQLQLTLFVLYAARQMRLSPGAIGIDLACFGVGGALAALIQSRAHARLGYGPILIGGYAVGAFAIGWLPLVPGPPAVSAVGFGAVYFFAGIGIVTANITMMTLRQIATPASLQGRMHASFRFAIGAMMPFSAAIAGVLGEWLGLRTTLFICAAGMPISVIWVAASPTRRVRTARELAAADPRTASAG